MQKLQKLQHCICWRCTPSLPTLSHNPPPAGCEVVGACYMIWSMLSRGERGECLGYRTQWQWDGKTKVSWCSVSHPCNNTDCQHLTWITHPVCLSGSSLDRFFIWGRWRTTCPLCQCFLPQLPADVPMQRKVGPQEGCCRRTGQSCCGGHLLNPESSSRFFSPALQKSSSHLPLWHDLDTMSESSLWTLLSNFNMPHFLSGARLRRSQR